MAKKKYYGVMKGHTPGIYFTWDDCKKQVEHFPGAVYKGFETIEEAEAFVKSGSQEACVYSGKEQLVSDKECLIAYVDGSYDDEQKMYAYGCVLVFEDHVETLNGKDAKQEDISMRNVAGEILGSRKAVEWAIQNGYKKIIIFYDYEGIEKWANNVWKANKPGTLGYKEFIADKRKVIDISFVKVTAHKGDKYNEMADKLAKNALGILEL